MTYASPRPVVAEHRPAGFAIGRDGALFISDDQRGRIWRVVYTGEATPNQGVRVLEKKQWPRW